MNIRVTNRSGATRDVAATEGISVMRLIRDAKIDELQAICGGECACATCHVIVDESWFGKLPPMKEIEGDLLDCSDERTATSRLSCQVPFTAALVGMHVTIAPEG